MAEPVNAQPDLSINYDSSTHGDLSVHQGTVVGDYSSHEQFQAHTEAQNLNAWSDTSAHGHFTNMHDFDVSGASASHFAYENHGPGAPEHQTQSFAPHGTSHTGVFEGSHGSGSHPGGHHDSGGHHDGGHADHGGSHGL